MMTSITMARFIPLKQYAHKPTTQSYIVNYSVRTLAWAMTLFFSSTLFSISPTYAEDHHQNSHFVQVLSSSIAHPIVEKINLLMIEEAISPPKTFRIYETNELVGFNLFCSGRDNHLPSMFIATRAINKKERAICKRKKNGPITEFILGYIGVILINSSALAKDLSIHQLWDFTSVAGSHPNYWPSKNDLRLPFQIAFSESGSEKSLWDHLVMRPEARNLPSDQMNSSKTTNDFRVDNTVIFIDPSLPTLTMKLKEDPELAAVTNFSFLDDQDSNLNTIKVNGISPSEETIRELLYPLSIPLYLYVKAEHVPHKAAIIDYILAFTDKSTANIGNYLSDAGLITPNETLRRYNQLNLEKLGKILSP